MSLLDKAIRDVNKAIGKKSPKKARVLAAAKSATKHGSDPMSGPTVARVVHQQKVLNPRSREHYLYVKHQWNKSPRVVQAKKDMLAAQHEFQHGDRKLAKAMLTKAGNRLENERQKLDAVAAPVYKAYMNRLWREVRGDYHGKRPTASIEAPENMGNGAAYADAPRGSNHVEYSIGALRDYVGAHGNNRNDAKTVPLHEWTHLRQNDAAFASTLLAEGGADAMRVLEELKLGLPLRTSKAYDTYRRAVAKQGRGYIRHGQMMTAKQIRARERRKPKK